MIAIHLVNMAQQQQHLTQQQSHQAAWGAEGTETRFGGLPGASGPSHSLGVDPADEHHNGETQQFSPYHPTFVFTSPDPRYVALESATVSYLHSPTSSPNTNYSWGSSPALWLGSNDQQHLSPSAASSWPDFAGPSQPPHVDTTFNTATYDNANNFYVAQHTSPHAAPHNDPDSDVGGITNGVEHIHLSQNSETVLEPIGQVDPLSTAPQRTPSGRGANFKCKFPGCPVTFSDRKNRERHYLSDRHNTNAPKFLCVCGYDQARKDLYWRHLKNCRAYAEPPNVYTCSCGYQTSDMETHRAHVKLCGRRRRGRGPAS
ncbi:hypothetical protein B0H63DRAFT_78126 [Podospora didyma]|uniref:C2H2-type domain-containing protein n=1 Tax=Podospora didyma TaxID=330526 RepID=A0AAE0K2W9_9PEZI|nr:hypothetical protein B0H63DRAFT_78126 [Podospora didyma]